MRQMRFYRTLKLYSQAPHPVGYKQIPEELPKITFSQKVDIEAMRERLDALESKIFIINEKLNTTYNKYHYKFRFSYLFFSICLSLIIIDFIKFVLREIDRRASKNKIELTS